MNDNPNIWTHSHAGIILQIYIRCMYIGYIFVYMFICIYENKGVTFYLIFWEYHVIVIMHRYEAMDI